jgi:hypothetical protein
MHRVLPARIIPVVLALVAVAMAAFVVTISAAGAAPSLVAQAEATSTVPGSVTGSPVAIPTIPAGSIPAGTAAVASPDALATAAAASAVAPPSLPPPVPQVADTGGGISRGELIETLIGVAAAIVVVGLGAWGLIRLIATA